MIRRLKTEEEKVRELHKVGFNTMQIAKELGFSDGKVGKFCKKIGLSFKKSDMAALARDRFVQKENLMVQLYKEGKTSREIAKEVNENNSTVWRYLDNKGYKFTKDRIEFWTKYQVDETFFERIDTQEKAYYLGFLYADGSIMKDSFTISIVDLEILEILKEKIKYTGPIYKRTNNTRSNNQQSYDLCIGRQKMVEDIIKLGCGPNKSLTIQFPNKDQVSKEFLPHFIRGWFDGDGSVYKNAQNAWKVCFVGTKEMLQGIVDVCKVEGYWEHPKPAKNKNKNTWTFYIGKQSEISKFLSFIYTDATIFLKRKHDKYLQYLADSL